LLFVCAATREELTAAAAMAESPGHGWRGRVKDKILDKLDYLGFYTIFLRIKLEFSSTFTLVVFKMPRST
jgi:hypothetical protein